MVLLTTLVVCCIPAFQAQGQNPPTTIPVVLAEPTGISRTAGPVRGGIPLGKGLLSDVGIITCDYSVGTKKEIEAATWAMSRWPDGSIRWLGIEFQAPPLAAHSRQQLDFKLKTKTAKALASSFSPTTENDGGLFEIDSAQLNGPLSFSFKAETAFGPPPSRLSVGVQTIELATSQSCTLRREDSLLSDDGREVIRFITRATNYRDSNLVHIAHTMEVVRGTHFNPQWSLQLPIKNPGKELDHRQRNEKFASLDGKSRTHKLSGVHQENNLTVAMTDFWKLFPTGFKRTGEQLQILLACPDADDHMVLEPGVARTHHLWIWSGDQQPSEEQAVAQADAPIVPFTTPQWAVASAAAGPLMKPAADSRLDDVVEMSIDRVFKFAEKQGHHYGFFDWGDFFVHDGTLSYTGCINQEYDPAMVMHLAYLRTGNPQMLLRAMPMARHYSDVDIATSGGVFQHRATRHHADAWIAKVLADGFYGSIKQAKGFDGSPESLLRIVKKKNQAMARGIEPLIRPLLDSGEPAHEITRIALEIMGQNIVNNIVNKLGDGGDDMTMKRYCDGIAGSTLARDYGFKNADASFKQFFDLYGGSWDQFPTFHVDNSPDPTARHTGGHSLVEGVIFGWWETGDPRLLEVALRVGRHHVEVLVPQELGKLGDGLGGDGNPRTRTVAWPLINMCRLYEATEGMAGQEELHAELYASSKECAEALILVPFERIEGSIHAGVTMEALANWHQLSNDQATGEYLVGLARYWASNVFDKRSNAFRYKAHQTSNAARGFSGLVSYGLAYAQRLNPHAATWKVFKQAWTEMLKPQKKAKPMAMTLRSAARAF